MDYEKRIWLHILAFLIVVPMVFCSLLIPVFSDIEFDIEQFAVDQAGRLYIHYPSSGDIHVYQDGTFLYNYAQMNDMTEYMDSRVRFIITQENEFWIQARGTFYAMDLEGNLLQALAGTSHTSEIDGHDGIYQDAQGNIYRMRGKAFGRTRIVKNDTEIVFAISTTSFVWKIVRIISVLSIFPLVLSFLYTIFRYRRDFGI